MVLIIGLINLAGPQNAQAQMMGDVSDEDARLAADGGLTVTGGGDMSLSPAFKADVANYTYKVDNTVVEVVFAGTAATDYTVSYSMSGHPTSWSIIGGTVTLGTADIPAPGSAKVTVMVEGNTGTDEEGKTATYVITLTKMPADVDANGPRLATLVIAEGATGGDGVTLMRKYGADEFNGAINSYTADVDFDVQSVGVDATAVGTNGVTAIVIEPANSTTTNPENTSDTDHQVKLRLGPTTIKVKTTGPGSRAEYTVVVTRHKPTLEALTFTGGFTGDANYLATGADTPAGGEAFMARKYDYTINLPFQETSVTVAPTGATSNGDRQRNATSPTTTPTFMPGETKKTTVTVYADLPDAYGETGDRTATSSRAYTITATRGAPKLGAAVADTHASNGLRIFHGATTAPPEGDTETGWGLTPPYSPDVTSYTATVPYQYSYVTIETTAGEVPLNAVATGDGITISAPDSRSGVNGYQADLVPGASKTVKVTARSEKKGTVKTDYSITFMRERTVLDNLAICEGMEDPLIDCDNVDPDVGVGKDALAENGQIGLMRPRTTTIEAFASTTAMYTAEVNYWVESVTAQAHVADDGNGRKVKFTSPMATSGNPLGVDLRVGDNDITAVAYIPDNESEPYRVRLDRREPEPVIQFRLYDKNGEEIFPPDSSDLPLELVSAFRRYTMDRDDGFNVNVASVRVNVFLGDNVMNDDVKVSVGRVSIPVDTSEGFSDTDGYHTMDLDEGTNTIAFEVEYRQHPDDDNLSGRSVHTLTISREGDSRPVFRPNHSLGQIVIEMVEEINVDTSTTALPHGVNGNGDLSYNLEGKGGATLPKGLMMHDPVGREMDGWIYGAPDIDPESAWGEHTLILSVADSDDNEASSDEDMVEFTIRIFRDEEARRAFHTPSTTAPAQLINLGVFYTDPANEMDMVDCQPSKATLNMRRSGDQNINGKTDCGMLMPKFDPATMAYTLELPTDVETVDIHAVATTSATLTLRGPGSAELGAGSNMFTVDGGKRHEWNGYRVLNGGPAQTDNIYILKVTEGTTDVNEYRVTITRETDTRVMFSAADKAMDHSYRFYYDIMPNGTTGSSKVTLPAAMPDSGNGSTSTWTYSLDRTDTGGEVEKKDFEGLMLTGSRMLMGTPNLDTDGQGRLSDRSHAPGKYTVEDADQNTAASDGDSIDVSVTVYRDVTLESYRVGDTTVYDLGVASRNISMDWSAGDPNDDYSDWVYTWDARDDSGAMLVDAYTFPVSHDATEATFSAMKNNGDATVSITPADADTDQIGHQVSLGRGNNVVTVTVTNGDVMATHKINLVRPGQQASDISVTTDRGTPVGADAEVKLSPVFDRDIYTYTATVESWIETLQIQATAIDPAATVSVNLDAINTAVGFAEVRLNEPEGSEDSTTVFRIGITNPTVSAAPGLYMLTVTRKGNTAPAFDMMQDDKTLKNGEAMVNIVLPEATGGNGVISHKLTAEELPNGLTYSESTRTISGTPVLTVEQGYESDFVLTYTAVDMDSDTSDADAASQTFTLTVTNGDVLTEPVDNGFGPDENYNTLRSLVVSFQRSGETERIATLVPAFNPSEDGPYTAIVPHDAENVWVTPSLSDAGAALWIDSISQQDARKVKILSTTTIMVEHTTHPALGSMTYTVELSPTNQSVPSFAGKSIDDIVVLAGEDMGTVQLPAADGGNTDLQPLTYTLKDHGGREIPRRGIGGIKFDASARTLSGTPVLNADADRTQYNLSYQATDQDGDMSEAVEFMVTVCRSADMPGCSLTAPEPNPGYTPMGLEVSISGNTATLTWRPGDDAMRQFVGAVDPTATDIFSTIRPAPFGDDQVAADADRYVIENLLDGGANYVFVVAGYDGSEWHVAVGQ